ncbi:MAG: SpoIIE family protein phosphatase [Spirochaetaceae bacterium]|jgi:sigma-B regulation protein RsbU (phosphoserine phosphatase)|nr:SpoIIE family protein phosphatase [Spirochaetaceae bacterium]
MFKKLFRNVKIGTKILCVVLTVSLLTLLLISVISYTQMINLTKLSQDANIQLGITASDKTKNALILLAQEYTQNIAREQAESSEAFLGQISTEIEALTDYVERLYANPGNFRGKQVDFVPDATDGILSAKYMLAPGVSGTNSVMTELRLLSNSEYAFSGVMENNKMFNNIYIGTGTGISYRYSRGNAHDPKYDPRSRVWYTSAMKDTGKTVWIDTYIDAFGRTCVTCCRAFKNGNGVYAGVVATDIILSSVIERILALKIKSNGYGFLLNRNGVYIAHPKYGEPGFNENALEEAQGEWKEALEKTLSGKYGDYTASISGIEYYISLVPLDSQGWTLGVCVPIQEITAPANDAKKQIDVYTDNAQKEIQSTLSKILLNFIIIFVITAILVIGLAFALSLTIIKPLQHLAHSVHQIGSGNLDTRIIVEGSDEIAELGNAFNKMIVDLQEYIENLKLVTSEKERINGELSAAADIQNDMLPHIFPKFARHKQLKLYAKMIPAKQVGGDFYDFFYLDNNHSKIAFIIADVSGKGVSAALFMVIAKTLLKTQIMRETDPALALENVNNLLCEDNSSCMFVTVFLCCLNLITGELSYVNAGHNPPLISGENEYFRFLKLEPGIPLGIFENSVYTRCDIKLKNGNKLYLYTDGVNEAMNPESELWGNDNFLKTANELRRLEPEEFDTAMRNEITAFSSGAEQSDDITTMAITYLQNPND